jgi:hypothetical protein
MLFFSFIAFINAYNPCISCKFYISPKNNDYQGFCKKFKNISNISNIDKSVVIYDYAIDCRSNENKCGKEGILYEQNDEFIRNKFLEDYELLNNRCCGEVNEKDELEELEKEFFEIFQRIKKYNKKRFINSANDLYKLFKDKQ